MHSLRFCLLLGLVDHSPRTKKSSLQSYHTAKGCEQNIPGTSLHIHYTAKMLEIKLLDLNQTNRPEIVGHIRPIDTKMKRQFLHR
jgi:hypothetical protein